jgi:D-alanyl-D-alanine carboxypeptidase
MIKKLFLCAILAIASNSSSSYEIKAKSWLIADGQGNVLEQENIEIQQPIASITKLMTAMIILDANENLEQPLKKKFRGLTVNREQLINLAVVKSDNIAARML